MPRAAVIVPFPYDEEGLDYRRAEMEQVELSGRVTFDYKPLKAGPMHFLGRHDEMLVEFAILEAGIALAEEGYDAITVNTLSDSGVAELRAVLDIPVVSNGKSSLLYALTLGTRFCVIAQTDPSYPQYTDGQNLHFMSFREPVGVVGAIIPWNAPLMMFALKVAPALATGCTIVLKPSELASLAALRLAEIVAECDLPPGVFNVVTGGPRTGAAISEHPCIDKITFTGSAVVGEKIMSVAGRNMKRVTLELGGKSAGLVFPDTRSIEVAAKTVMALSSTFLSGQVCSTPTRAVVHRSILEEFIEHAHAQIASVRFGDPFDPATTSAPIISKRQTERIMGFIAKGREEGAQLVFGGDRPKGDLAQGNWINPTLFSDVTNGMTIAREEIFGPVLSVIPFDTEEEAVAIANDSQYGLSGGIWSSDLSRAFRVGRAMRTGTIGVNGYSVMPNSPAGGIKRSGIGREGGRATIEAFTELKTMILNLDA